MLICLFLFDFELLLHSGHHCLSISCVVTFFSYCVLSLCSEAHFREEDTLNGLPRAVCWLPDQCASVERQGCVLRWLPFRGTCEIEQTPGNEPKLCQATDLEEAERPMLVAPAPPLLSPFCIPVKEFTYQPTAHVA